jgi:hypothetical protein
MSVDDADFQSGGLKQVSNIRPNRLFTADVHIVLYRIGTIKFAVGIKNVYFWNVLRFSRDDCTMLRSSVYHYRTKCATFIYWVFPLLVGGWNLFWILRFPHQIVLRPDDGTIEFRAVIRRVTMNAIEIESMKSTNATFGFINVKGKKKIRILSQFDNFHEFVLKLKQLNPSIIIRGC